MDDPRLIVAIGRIERGLAQIERATAAAVRRSERAEAKHRALRGATAAILADVDRLLAEQG